MEFYKLMLRKTEVIVCLMVTLITVYLSTESVAQTISVTIPQANRNITANTASGIATNAFKDANINADSIRALSPKYLRWPEGASGDLIHFNKKNPSIFKLGINETSWWLDYMKADKVNLTVAPEFDFDSFIALCKEVGAEPIVIIGIWSAYTDSNEKTMTKEEVFEAAKDFITYANVTNKYNVKYWEIGNENDLQGADVSTYASIFNELVPQLKSIDPFIKCGANYMSGLTGWKQLIPLVKLNADFYVTHSYAWLDYNKYNEWYTHENGWSWAFTAADATKALAANPDASQALFLTELSSYAPGGTDEASGSISNVTWKCLMNIQMHLEALSLPYTKASIFWNTRWNDQSRICYNAFSPDYHITPIGLSLAAFTNHLYNNLGSKNASSTGYVTLWISHNDAKDKMSVFLLNRGSSESKISLTINGYAGNYHHEKWVYKGSSANSIDVTLSKEASENISNKSFNLTLPPLSFTVLDFNNPDNNTLIQNLQSNDNNKVSIHPNPLINNDLTIELKGLNTVGSIHVIISDVSGRVLYKNALKIKDNQSLKINRHLFIPGVYFVKIKYSDTENKVFKLIVNAN